MRIEILDKAEDDLVEGFQFYEDQQAGLGSYFLEACILTLNHCVCVQASIGWFIAPTIGCCQALPIRRFLSRCRGDRFCSRSRGLPKKSGVDSTPLEMRAPAAKKSRSHCERLRS
jgi:hypothetical protein